MKLVIGGTTGGIGRELTQALQASSTGRASLNVEDENSIAAFFDLHKWTLENEPLHVINATGVSISSMLHKTDVLDISRMLRVNVTANILLLKHLRPLFKTLLPGSTFTMLGSVTVDQGTVGTGVYTACKAALRGLVRVAANEFAPFARVNLIELGYSMYGMIQQVPRVDVLIETIPMRRLAVTGDIVAAVTHVIDNQYLTGSITKVNGGLA